MVEFTSLDVVATALGSLAGGWYLWTNHWAANNLFGVCFSIEGIEMLSLGSWKNGAILLVGLFFYDIFWVFGTDVMVTVAKGFDGPIKLLFPNPNPEERHSLLGLGDIVVPGIFVALMLRFDVSLSPTRTLQNCNQTHFKGQVVAYASALAVTLCSMYFFDAAQPALLYLVPACLGASLLTTVATGQFKELWAYEEGGEGEESKAAKKTD